MPVWRAASKTAGVLFALLIINFLAALCMLLPWLDVANYDKPDAW